MTHSKNGFFESPRQWINFPRLVRGELMPAARALLDLPENPHVIALGQSPAWVAEAAVGMHPEFGHRMQHVAMSKKIIDGVYSARNTTHKTFSNNPVRHTLQQEEGYRRYLHSIGITPQSIWNRFQQNGQKTCVFDFVTSGAGLASFLWILVRWGKDTGIKDLSQALTFFAMSAHSETTHIELPDKRTTISGETRLISERFFHTLGSSIDTGAESDRLVAMYPPDAWERLPEAPKENEQTIASIREGLQAFINNPQHQPHSRLAKREILEDIYQAYTNRRPDTIPNVAENLIREYSPFLNTHRNRFGMFSPRNIARNLSSIADVPWDATTSYRELLEMQEMQARSLQQGA